MDKECYVDRAREGICLVLNNQPDSAEDLFDSKNDHIHMAAGKCYVSLISAVLSYEKEKIYDAVEEIKELEKRCARDVGWVKSVKDRVFGSSVSLNDPDLIERLDEQVVLADCQVCVALLTFLQQDLSSYVKGGWRLRKAWKVYQHTYTTILDLYRKTFPMDPEVPGSEFPSWCVVTKSASCELSSPNDWSVPATPSQSGFLRSSLSYLSSFAFAPSAAHENQIPPEVVARLMAAISFGYGIFQLCVSLMPPALTRIIHILGFDGDRKMGLNALMFARLGNDMRGPLASLALLWYHTVLCPFLALDGGLVETGLEVASQLYEESKSEFADSAIFLFFLGRIQRLKGNLPESLKAYENAISKSPQREVQLLLLHEIGWCYMIQLQWGNAYHCFDQLRTKSRWSKLLYSYITAVCIGARGNTTLANEIFEKIPKMLDKHGYDQMSNVEIFVARRIQKLPEYPSKDCCLILGLELLYLWNALITCASPEIIIACESCSEEPMVGLKTFLQGVTHKYIGEVDKAEDCLRQTLLARSDILCSVDDPFENDDHVSAFAALELAKILLRSKETTEEGNLLMLQVKEKYKGYDFEGKASIRIHASLQ